MDTRSRKRSRADGGAAAYTAAARRAMAIAAKIKSAYPYSDYGRAYYRRGTPENLARFGASYRTATDDQRALRKSLGYVGKGMYRGRGGYWGRLIGSKLGMADLGDKLGDLASGAITAWNPALGSALSTLSGVGAQIHKTMTGQGAYVSNDIVDGGVGTPVPMFTKSNDGTITLSNREYISDIFAPLEPSAFLNTTYPINPGIERTFPWLCQVAENYEEYTLKQCIFTFKSTVTDYAAATGQVGQVIMATQYNASSAPFGDKQTMMQYAFSSSGKTSQDMLQGIECDPTKLSGTIGRFVRNGPIPIGVSGDVNLYDHGVLNVALTDCPATYAGQQMGELWVSYTIELRKPKFVTANGWGITRDCYVATQGDARAPFGNGLNAYGGQQNSLGSSLIFPSVPGTTMLSSAYTQGAVLFGSRPFADCLFSFSIQIPSWYSGNLTVRWCQNPISGDQLYPFTVFTAQGSNIEPINDIPYSNTPGAVVSWNAYSNTQQDTAAITDASVAQELHIRVEPPLNGGTNVLLFGYEQDGAQTNMGFMIDLAEYNTLFNLSQNGSNDRIGLVNLATQQIAGLG